MNIFINESRISPCCGRYVPQRAPDISEQLISILIPNKLQLQHVLS